VEVHVPRRVDEVEHEPLGLPAPGRGVVVEDGHGRRLDRDPPLALQVHVVEDLLLELPLRDGAGPHQQAVGQGALAVVDVGDD
jgi:hypothetical protein